VKAKENTTW